MQYTVIMLRIFGCSNWKIRIKFLLRVGFLPAVKFCPFSLLLMHFRRDKVDSEMSVAECTFPNTRAFSSVTCLPCNRPYTAPVRNTTLPTTFMHQTKHFLCRHKL